MPRTTRSSAEAMPVPIGPTWRSLPGAIAEVLRRLASPAPLAALLASGLLLLACNVTARVGHGAVVFKHFYPRAYFLLVVLALAYRLSALSASAWRGLRSLLGRALLAFGLLALLIGVSVLVSNGTTYAEMASNYWLTDPFGSTSRRVGLPVLAHVLGFEKNGYVFFWYAVLFGSVASALALLDRGRLAGIEKLSLLSSSILAYAFVGPGYSEVFVLMLGCGALLIRTSTVDKVVLAALMLSTHETATALTALAIVVKTEGEERADWLVVFGTLYGLYVAAYLFAWRGEVVQALLTAGRPSPGASETAPGLVLAYPGRALLGTVLAYKLYWAIVPVGLGHPRLRPMTLAMLVSLILAVIGTDTSRLVEFSTLAFLLLALEILPGWPRRLRIALALANLLVPSLYVATNAEPLWGDGLYSAYLHGAKAAGWDWGRLFAADAQ